MAFDWKRNIKYTIESDLMRNIFAIANQSSHLHSNEYFILDCYNFKSIFYADLYIRNHEDKNLNTLFKRTSSKNSLNHALIALFAKLKPIAV